MIYPRVVALALLALSVTASHAQYWETTSGPPAPTTCLATNSKGTVFAGTTASAVYRTTDNGETWERKDQGIDDGGLDLYTVNAIKLGYNDVLYAAVNGIGVVKSTNDGDTWQKLTLDFPVNKTALITLSTKLLPNNVTAVFIGYDGGADSLLFRYSEDDGETFVDIPKTGLPSSMTAIYDVFLSPNSEKMFIAIAYNKGLFRTTNRGQTWRRIDNSDTPEGEASDNFMTFEADRNGRIYVGRNALSNSTKSLNAVILRSSDDGEDWEYLTNGWDNRDITNNRITGITVGKGTDVWAITEKVTGTFYSSDGGDSWISRNDGFESDGSGKGIVATPNNIVFVAPLGGFVYRHMIVSSVQDDIPSVVLTGASPNPAQESFRLDFENRQQQIITLQLVSADGQIVSEYKNVYDVGYQRALIDVANLSQGMYFWRIIHTGGVSTGSVAVISH